MLGEVKGDNCPWKEDQDEHHQDRKGDLCLRDFEVTGWDPSQEVWLRLTLPVPW